MLSSHLAIKFANRHTDPAAALCLLDAHHAHLQSQRTRDLLERDAARLLSRRFPDGRSPGHAMRLVGAVALLEILAATAPHTRRERIALLVAFATGQRHVVEEFEARADQMMIRIRRARAEEGRRMRRKEEQRRRRAGDASCRRGEEEEEELGGTDTSSGGGMEVHRREVERVKAASIDEVSEALGTLRVGNGQRHPG